MQIQCLFYETGVSPHFANEANVITLLSINANYVTSKAKNALQKHVRTVKGFVVLLHLDEFSTPWPCFLATTTAPNDLLHFDSAE